jgi:GTPase SAR1 family protein
MKIVIIGSSGVGKTAMMQRFVENKFSSTAQTIGVSFVVKEHRGLHLAIWVRSS